MAARAIVAIEHPSEVFVISCRQTGQRAVLKFAQHTGATPIAGRFTPGAFTNQIQVGIYLIIFNAKKLSFKTIYLSYRTYYVIIIYTLYVTCFILAIEFI